MHRSNAPLFLLAFLVVLVPSAAHATCYKPGDYSPPVTGTTHIESISPQVGVAGGTQVTIQGWCFGDSQGSGSITIGGVTVPTAQPGTPGITAWADAEIIFTVPFGAKTGDLVVTSSSYGHDDSATESARGCGDTDPNLDYCGNDNVNASFEVVTPSPALYDPNRYPPDLVQGAPNPSQYISGTWYYNDGLYVETLTLTQGSQNSSGVWPITGTETISSPSGCSSPTQTLGSLDKYGDLVLEDPCRDGECFEWLVLGSGDVTSQGFPITVAPCPNPVVNFLTTDMDESEGPYYYLARPPLFKSQTDLPPSETPAIPGWAAVNGSINATYGSWQRTFPPLGGFIGYAGRFLYEQTGAAGATDNCWATGDPSQVQQVTGVTGGGWYVYNDDTWSPDFIGMNSQSNDWYQKNQPNLPCHFTVPQDMYIDGRTQTWKYTTDQLTFEIDATKIYSEVQPQGGSVVEGCEYYSNSKVGNRKCTP